MTTLASRLGLAAAFACAALPTLAQESAFGPKDAKYTYYWISNKANLPLFVQYDYVGMEKIANELGVRVIVGGPTDFEPRLHRCRRPDLRPEAERRLGRRRLGSVAQRAGAPLRRTGRTYRRGRW